MWLGEQIDEYGIGNGISLLIMAGILAQMPKALYELVRNMKTELTGLSRGQVGIETLILLVILFVGVVFGVVFITLGQRKDPDTIGQIHAWTEGVWRNPSALATAN